MEHRHDDFGGGYAFLVHIHGDTPAIVRHGHRFVGVYHDPDFRTVARQGLIDGIVHQFENHVVKTGAIVCVTDIHTGTLADGIQSFQHLDTGRIVLVVDFGAHS